MIDYLYRARRRAGLNVAGTLMLAAVSPWPALAQQHPSFAGVWSGVFTTQDNPFWQVEDFSCFAGCTKKAYAFLQGLLDDKANDEKPLEALQGQFFGFHRTELKGKLTEAGLAIQDAQNEANDPTLLCQPYGWFRESTNPLPIQIREEGGNLVIRYEEWEKTRTIYMDGRGHPKTLTLTDMGHSIGRYEGDALVVDTVGLKGDIFFSFLSGGGYADQARGHERYTILDSPRRMHLEITVEDSVNLEEPYTSTKTWLYTPDVQLVVDSCGDTPAKP
jgi:hypothetical protein